MSIHSLLSRRVADAAMAACAALVLVVVAWHPIERLEARAVADTSVSSEQIEMSYTLRFDGVGAEGVDNIWTGSMVGAPHGEITLRVAHRGPEVDRAKARWPVTAIVFVAADDPRESFAAELQGTLDWTTGRMRLSGGITEGWMKGAAVWQNVELDPREFDGAGTLTVGLVTAKR
jgi:hypothetical protein